MRGRTTFQLAILALTLTCGLYLLDEHLDRRHRVRVQVQKVFDLTVDPVASVRFERDGRRVEFVRKGDLWFVQSPLRARANAPLVEQRVATLETLRRQDSISHTHRAERGLTLADYGLDPPRARIHIETGGGRVETLMLGDQTPFGGSLYARDGRSDEVFTLPDSVEALFPDDLSALRDRTLVYGMPENTDRLDIFRRDTGFVQLVRRKSGWVLQQPLEAPADAAAVRRLLDAVFALRVETFRWDAESESSPDADRASRMEMALRGQIEAGGLASDAARVRLTVWTEGDRLGQELFFGRAAEGATGHVFARKGGVDAIYTVSGDILNACSVAVDALRDRTVMRLPMEDVGFIRLQSGENRVDLRRRLEDAGDPWQLLTPVQAPADHEAVRQLLARLAGLRVQTYLPVPAPEPAPPVLRILLAPSPAAGTNAFHADAGATELVLDADSPDAAQRTARITGRHEAFTLDRALTQGLDAALVSPLLFRDRRMLMMNTGAVFRIRRTAPPPRRTEQVEGGPGSDSGEWRCVDDDGKTHPADGSVVASVLAALGSFKAERLVDFMPSDPGRYGLDPPVMTMTFGFRTSDAILKTLLVGNESREQWRYARIQGNPFVFEISSSVLTRLWEPWRLPPPKAAGPDSRPGSAMPPDAPVAGTGESR